MNNEKDTLYLLVERLKEIKKELHKLEEEETNIIEMLQKEYHITVCHSR